MNYLLSDFKCLFSVKAGFTRGPAFCFQAEKETRFLHIK
jgi:hypothetical protein